MHGFIVHMFRFTDLQVHGFVESHVHRFIGSQVHRFIASQVHGFKKRSGEVNFLSIAHYWGTLLVAVRHKCGKMLYNSALPYDQLCIPIGFMIMSS